MEFPPVTIAKWRELVEKDLAGKSFDQALVHEAMEGIRISPLYTGVPPGDAAPRALPQSRFQICMRHAGLVDLAALLADVRDGADALWLELASTPSALFERPELLSTFLIFDVDGAAPEPALERIAGLVSVAAPRRFALSCDPIARRAQGRASFAELPAELSSLGRAGRLAAERFDGATAALVSTLAYHEAGADAAEELAIALATGACYLGALLEAGLAPERAAQQIALQPAVGRDTFVELCKLRAMRLCWRKVLAASGAAGAGAARVHAVCSRRTLTVRDPWVNMLRATTQVFAAVLGGADLITPSAFDELLGAPSALGRRVARNTGLVLREESLLGQVGDPAGGSYYFESLTDALARKAWARFQRIEQQGGISAVLQSGELAAQLKSGREKQLDRIARRRVPILGVSEFANLGETLPPRAEPLRTVSEPPGAALVATRDAAAFEQLRARSEAAAPPLEALLITLGSYSESRPRADFARGFFAAGGLRTRESRTDEKARLACLCGSDERYADEAAARARALKAAGCSRVLLAGRPGASEAALRAAGVDGFIFLGCDAVATLTELLAPLELPS